MAINHSNDIIFGMLIKSAEERNDNAGAALILSKVDSMKKLSRFVVNTSMWYLKANPEQKQELKSLFWGEAFDTLDLLDEDVIEESNDLLDALEKISK